jgi:mannose-6-phosphate isomerase-like protein (cupin superfamily)
MQIIEGAGLWTTPRAAANDWVEHLKVPDLSVGTYCIPAGGVDDQNPHTEDEIYVVTAGHATIRTPSGTAKVGPGAVIFVPAGEEHRFEEVTEDLALLVVFGPAYGSRAVVAEVHDQGGHREGEEHGPPDELAGMDPQVSNKRADEVEHETGGGEVAQQRHGEAGQKP